jgi:choline kinase
MKVVIIAAGMGSRLWERTLQKPKTLLPFGQGTILSTIIERFRSIGMDEFVIVTGYQGDEIVRYVEREKRFGVGVQLHENKDWSRGNGLSVLAAAEAVAGAPFILSMSDHLVSSAALARVAGHPSERNLLLVDRRVNDVFDLDDATKVQVEEGRIVEIGKALLAFNALDCGIFRLNDRFVRAMGTAVEAGVESISGGVRRLTGSGDMEAVELAPGERWLDVDTPEAYGHGLLLAADVNGRAAAVPASGPFVSDPSSPGP